MKHNKKKFIIGITGGIASGKSTVSEILKKRGFTVIDVDQISKKLMEEDRRLFAQIVDYFGEEILDKNLSINRKKLGEIVFKDSEKREKLESLIHPKIFKEIEIYLKESEEELIFIDIPLLYETKDKLEKYSIDFSEIWLVYVDYPTQLKRLMDRDKIGEKEAKRKIKSQISLEEKIKRAELIIDNNNGRLELEKQVEKLIEDIRL